MSFRRILAIAVALAASALTYGQGFLVRPSSAEFTVKPGTTDSLQIEVRNIATDKARTVDIFCAVLDENLGGFTFEPLKPDNQSRSYSCSSWVTLDNSALENIPPLSTRTFNAVIHVPASAHGFYSAAIMVKSRPDAVKAGVPFVVQFLIPLLMDVQGTPGSRIAEPENAGLMDIPPDGKGGAQTLVGISVKNSGETLLHVEGKGELYFEQGSRWRLITKLDFLSRRLIPDSTVGLTTVLPRRLPSGGYRIDADLTADGQVLPRFSRTFSFKGDPSVTQIESDVNLQIDPMEVRIDAPPGSLRSQSIALANPTDQPIRVDTSMDVPPDMKAMSIGNTTDQDYSAISWLRVLPQSVVIGANGTRTVKIVATEPIPSSRPNYYALLRFAVSSTSGDSLGSAEELVTVHNPKVTAAPSLAPSGPISISKLGSGSYAVSLGIVNTGNDRLDPTGFVRITDPSGTSEILHVDATRDSGAMLPLANRRFAATINAGGLKPGVYAIEFIVNDGTTRTESALPIKVTASNGERAIAPLESSPSPPTAGGKG